MYLFVNESLTSQYFSFNWLDNYSILFICLMVCHPRRN